ncbi:protein export chaperone secb [Sphingobacterium sp. DK4209]|uniref:Protein export chaperone secb n=1 Tax=Sphingobacterium zhuxiongii TaxID=2662364 RepID=A0A5Q0QBP9_9SPHI|nr:MULTISPECIES: protein-export chaperone SecB [unclassified Sphingobacterium]MVZ67612.1 protein export chaperone secb [Sphingobacterium sp. DK4209]QGA26694.1 protein export chaperone secb [Sphingobacterium sp. dk4302]
MTEIKVKDTKAKISLDSVIFEELIIKRSPKKQGDFEMNIFPAGRFLKNNKKFQLNLVIDLVDKNEAFTMKLNSVALFSIHDPESIKNETALFYVNAPAILFPYVRAYVNSITSLSGLKPVVLPIMNLLFLKDELMKNISYE